MRAPPRHGEKGGAVIFIQEWVSSLTGCIPHGRDPSSERQKETKTKKGKTARQRGDNLILYSETYYEGTAEFVAANLGTAPS